VSQEPLANAPTVAALAASILDGGDLAHKLQATTTPGGAPLPDTERGQRRVVTAPARSGALVFQPPTRGRKGDKLPPLSALSDPQARVACLSRFAHHEIMAVELFAWALLAFPDAPPALRRGMVAALAEEQAHARLYLSRLAAHGAVFGDLPLSGYFWQLVPALADAPDPAGRPDLVGLGPLLAFLCAQGLTLEAANLDFTILYRDAFQTAGDEETARVLQQVHDDEIAHVRLASTWLVKLTGDSDVTAYAAHVPFPLSPARAKGRRFERGARLRAGLSPALVDLVEQARPYGPRADG
jgi:uncharacterized ferritin-like protein (DUF455 family)